MELLTPVDTVATLAHHVQKHLDNDAIPTISISSACSSFVNAVEIVEGYFAMNKATCALVVSAELNSRLQMKKTLRPDTYGAMAQQLY